MEQPLDYIRDALEFAERYGMIDGEHHKQWVIDQMIRTLLGPEGYTQWVAQMNSDLEYAPWNVGIAP